MNAPSDTSKQILLALRRFRTTVAARDRAVATAAQLRESDLTVLDLLHREGPQTPTVLARRTSTHLATMTGILARLEKEGWIERSTADDDRRSIRVRAKSVERFNTLYADSVGSLLAVVEQWPAEHAQLFLDSITDLAQALENGDAPSNP